MPWRLYEIVIEMFYESVSYKTVVRLHGSVINVAWRCRESAMICKFSTRTMNVS